MEKKELIIIIICLIIPLIVFSFFGLNFIVTILLSLIVGSGGLFLANQSKNAAKVFAAASTLGVFYALGYTVYWFLNFIILAVIMYFYTSSSNIEDALLKIIVLTTTIGLLGYWRYTKSKEGFLITSALKKMGDALTAKNCQDLCEANIGCRYAQVPVGTSKTGGNYECKIGYSFNQGPPTGNKNQGGDTWINKKWKPPIIVSGGGSNIQTSPNRNQTVSIGKKYTNMIPKEITISASLRDQGWGNPTWGIYLVGNEAGTGKVVFLEKLQAPRTSRQERYPIYKRVAYRTTITKRKLAYDRPTYYWANPVWWHKLWRKRSVAYYGYWKNYSVPVTRYRNVVSSYGTRTVQGSPTTRSITKQVNPSNKKISSVYCYVNTTGSGHSLKMNNVNWSVRGWSV